MSAVFERRISRLLASESSRCLWGGLKGIEKESLRVEANGLLSMTPHPAGLGSALTNKFITTDFSEALLEFVTPTFANTWEALRFLCDLHQFTYEQLQDELLWVASMPCAIPVDGDIPLAQYGTSNVGRMKTIYRNGLSHRYGRNMQAIAGIHFNYSLPDDFWPVYRELEQDTGGADDFRSESYLSLVRNFRRMGWLILYLFGASPALCKTFIGADSPDMPSLDDNTLYQPFATSLRMSDLGYSNNTQANIHISLNNLNKYIDDLSHAIMTPEPEFEKIGIKANGEYRQLNVNQLQIENEYYNTVRPKRVANTGERPTAALRRGGIEYVEIRSLDLNLFDPVGISQNTMRFVEAFLIYCLLEDSPRFESDAYDEAAANHSVTASSGRDPEMRLQRNGRPVRINSWAAEILDKVRPIAEILDRGSDRNDYVQSVEAHTALVSDPDLTPSARVLSDLRVHGGGFFQYAFEAARNHKTYFAETEPLRAELQKLFADEAAQSNERQAEIEASDDIDLDEYLRRYFAS